MTSIRVSWTKGKQKTEADAWKSPTYAAHDAHDPPAGVIAHTSRLHGRPLKLFASLFDAERGVTRSSGACSRLSIDRWARCGKGEGSRYFTVRDED